MDGDLLAVKGVALLQHCSDGLKVACGAHHALLHQVLAARSCTVGLTPASSSIRREHIVSPAVDIRSVVLNVKPGAVRRLLLPTCEYTGLVCDGEVCAARLAVHTREKEESDAMGAA